MGQIPMRDDLTADLRGFQPKNAYLGHLETYSIRYGHSAFPSKMATTLDAIL